MRIKIGVLLFVTSGKCDIWLASRKKQQKDWLFCVEALAERAKKELRSIVCPGNLRSPQCWLMLLGNPVTGHSDQSVLLLLTDGLKCLFSLQFNSFLSFNAQLYFIWIQLTMNTVQSSCQSRNLSFSMSSIQLFNHEIIYIIINYNNLSEIIYNLWFFLLNLTTVFKWNNNN